MSTSSGGARITLRRNHLPKVRTLFAAALAALFLTPAHLAAARADDASVTVRGRVIDRESGQPIGNAQIMFADAGKRAYTDRDGGFEVGGLAPGEHHFSVTQLGYLRVQQVLVLTRGASFTVKLTRDPVMLARIGVQVDRLESRRLRAALASRVFDEREIGAYRRSSAVQFVTERTGLRPVGCGDMGETEPGCAWVRGEPSRVAVVIDERLQNYGMEDLSILPLNDIYRIEVYGGGEMVVVYTKQFMRTIIGRNVPLHPLSAYLQMQHGINLQRSGGVGLQP